MAAYVVPEHSRSLLEALSGGTAFDIDGYLFVAGEDWLMAIGYPQVGEAETARLEKALQEAVRRTGASLSLRSFRPGSAVTSRTATSTTRWPQTRPFRRVCAGRYAMRGSG